MSGSDIMILVACVAVGVLFFGIWILRESRYMKQQKTQETDKKRMMEIMSQIFQDRVSEYTFVAGRNTVSEYIGPNRRRYWYYSYYIAFTRDEICIFPFVVKKKEIHLRNRLDIDWSNTSLTYKTGRKEIELDFKIAGEPLEIHVPRVCKSIGQENSSEPLGFYQEEAVERLSAYLPAYPGTSGK